MRVSKHRFAITVLTHAHTISEIYCSDAMVIIFARSLRLHDICGHYVQFIRITGSAITTSVRGNDKTIHKWGIQRSHAIFMLNVTAVERKTGSTLTAHILIKGVLILILHDLILKMVKEHTHKV